MFLDVVRIVLGCLPLVNRVEVNACILGLDGLEESSESVLEAGSGQRCRRCRTSNVPLGVDLQRWGCLVALFSALHDSLYVFRCSGLVGRIERAEQMGGNESLKRGEVACGLSWKARATPRNAVPSLSQRGGDSFPSGQTRVCVCGSIILRSARWPEESAIYYSAYGMSSTQLKLYMILPCGALLCKEKRELRKRNQGGWSTAYCR